MGTVVGDLVPGLGDPGDFDAITEQTDDPDFPLLDGGTAVGRTPRRPPPTIRHDDEIDLAPVHVDQRTVTVFGTGCCGIPDTSSACRGLGMCMAAASIPTSDETDATGPGRSYTLVALLMMFAGVCMSLLLLHFRLATIASGDDPVSGWGGVLWPFVLVCGVCTVIFAYGTCTACYTATDTGEHGAGAFGGDAFGTDADVAHTRRRSAMMRAAMAVASTIACVVLFASSINAIVALDASDAGENASAASSGKIALVGVDIVSIGIFSVLLLSVGIRVQHARADWADSGALPSWATMTRH